MVGTRSLSRTRRQRREMKAHTRGGWDVDGDDTLQSSGEAIARCRLRDHAVDFESLRLKWKGRGTLFGLHSLRVGLW